MSITPDTPEETLEAAQAALREQRPADAVPIAEAITAADPENYDAWQTLAVAYSQSGRQQEAIQTFSRCVRLRPNLPQPHFNLAQALLTAGDREKARAEMELCLSVDPTYQKASQALSQLGPAPTAPTTGVPGLDNPAGYAGPVAGQVAQPGPVIGQAPPLYTPQPQSPYLPPQGPQFTPGAPGLAGGFVAPSGATQMYGSYSGQLQLGPPEMPSTTRVWCIVTIVLAALELLGAIGSILISAVTGSASMPGAPSVGPSGATMLVSVIRLLVSIAFIISCAGVLQRKSWGPRAVVGTAVAAIIYHCISAAVGYSKVNAVASNPAFTNNPAIANNPAFAHAPNMAAMIGPAAMGFIILGVLIALGYLIPLIMHMNSERVRSAMIN